jgi:hypothetical protein
MTHPSVQTRSGRSVGLGGLAVGRVYGSAAIGSSRAQPQRSLPLEGLESDHLCPQVEERAHEGKRLRQADVVGHDRARGHRRFTTSIAATMASCLSFGKVISRR